MTSEHEHVAVSGLWIYFLAVGNRLIKIGKSRKKRGSRLAQHRTASIDGHVPDVRPLCEVRASSDGDEVSVHRYFDHLREGPGNETFRAEPDLIDYVRWLRDEYYVSDSQDTDEVRDAMPLVDSDLWLPKPGRTKPRDTRLLPGMYPPFDLGPRVVTIDDFYTNTVIIEAARRAMGGIDLDPASHYVANTVVKAARFFTASTNGLAQPWQGRVWLNPPFSAWADWAAKIGREREAGRIEQLCTLASTGAITANYFHVLLTTCDAICIFKGRIGFWGGKTTTAKADAPATGHVVLYFGDRVDDFRREFSELGTVFCHAAKAVA